ncbi:MAG: hypothetical protein ACOY46_01810 [Bacillota bacterium]
MNQEKQLEEELKSLNDILRKESVTGYVQYHNDLPDSRYRGFWYSNPASRGFLGKRYIEAREALDVLVESVKLVNNSGNIKKSWYEKIKSFFK